MRTGRGAVMVDELMTKVEARRYLQWSPKVLVVVGRRACGFHWAGGSGAVDNRRGNTAVYA